MRNIKIILALTILFSCQNSSDTIERVEVSPTVLYQDLESVMPGNLRVFENYLLWTDPIRNENFVHLIDLTTGEEVGTYIQKGGGPEEFITPSLGEALNNQILIYDLNRDKLAIISLDSLSQNRESTNLIFNMNTKDATRVLALENNELLRFFPEKPNHIHCANQEFGSIPFNENAENLGSIMQGNLFYNPEKKSLIYASMSFPYMVLYKKERENQFHKIWEKKGEFNYQYSDNQIKVDQTKKGFMGLALSADYIVTLERDYKNDPTDETTVGRNLNKTPTTVFVYDYDGNLLKIIDTKMPVLRIAANEKSNTVYAIVTNPDFQIVKFDLN